MKNFLKNLFSRSRGREASDLEALRLSFKARYNRFKLLLNANSKALETMAEMEEALRGTRPFGMNFVRAKSTRVSTNVFQMVKNLNELAPERYKELYDRFKEIQQKISPFLHQKAPQTQGSLIISLQEVDRTLADKVGNKIANLGEVKNRIQLNVPNGFVITAGAYRLFMTHNNLQPEIDRLIQATDVGSLDQLYKLSAVIQQLIIRSNIPEELEKAILRHYAILEKEYGKEMKVALRSSALGEDFMGTSFAGQYRSELNVSPEHMFQVYKEIIASKYGLSAMAYRLNRGIRDEDVDMCVGCLPMVDAVAGGVAYSRNPVNIRDDTIIINSVWGLPKPVVDGSMPSDLFVISRETPMIILKREVPFKEQKFVCYPEEGVCRLDTTGDEGQDVSLNDAQALEIARLAVTLEMYYGLPQDVEWAIDGKGSIILLQCRPLKQLHISEKDIKDQKEGPSKSVILQGGVTASPGAAAGPVFIVKKEADALQFPTDAVLVTAQSLPRWAALMNRAVAVITEQGSVAGHLASVAREFQVPAIFGVEGALERLNRDQMVTVDADGLRVYDGRMDLLLERGEAPKNLMEGSPVYEALKGVAQHIIPLNLLHPDVPSFKADRCKTFHDITRFCHEKSVQEMFKFGKDHHFPEHSSKQLVCDVPMQWWVLNLDDGFEEELRGRYVELENIVSIPMLAIWEGIIAFPWEGPPPVDGRGFMSVLYQATTNTALTTGARSKYAERNYFMISKNYCSLTSRLGFHFSNIETMVGDRPMENYISFQFKGGAADSQRRVRRVYFIKEVLEEYGFRIEVREDHLLARMENYEKEWIRKRLKVLGYLTIHTRQLDMIMANPSKVSYYRAKIFRELGEMISQ